MALRAETANLPLHGGQVPRCLAGRGFFSRRLTARQRSGTESLQTFCWRGVDFEPNSHLRVNRRIVRNTAWVNYLGLCAITMPVGRDRAGMPIGLQLTAPARAEEKLLKIALAVERVLGTGADRLGMPPLLAS